ncbi:MAG: DEAD/DEAH box helicase family protein [Azospirillaceae bacterium]|nr:DEAD/DEAH box helicase family protein [Azospirillaceae bacterium]
MKLKFKVQPYQTNAVESVVDCFAGQPLVSGTSYRIDPGRKAQTSAFEEGFKNADLQLADAQVLANIRDVQKRQNLPLSDKLVVSAGCKFNLDVEMETGTGKTYCYIKTIFEMNKRYGWSKFIIMVPSIAIREGVYKSLQITADHFTESYGKKARFFIYNSKRLHELESFSSDAGINVMVINIQAFAAKGADNRRIYDELDDFQSRRPIDVIASNRPILILDEPQKMEGKATMEALPKFKPLAILRYSATHKTQHNRIHRLDALDAYNQKLVKKIAVRGIQTRGLAGTNAYLYLEGIEISKKAPVARIELEVRLKSGEIKRQLKRLEFRDDLFVESGELDQYHDGFTISQIDYNHDTVEFTNGLVLKAGEATGDVSERDIRRIQIRETIKAHFDKEKQLFAQGIKVLSLFFIDEVVKYRDYSQADEKGEYARVFEDEYGLLKTEYLSELALDNEKYHAFLERDPTAKVHEGYFSIDKQKRLVDPDIKKTGEDKGLSDDTDAYDLILKNKERLLSQDEPVRFIFSHSALREGWDNPNVFVMCMLKHSDNMISRRQEVGRGLRLSVNQNGDRMDQPAIVHDINVLTVVASESYKDFVAGLQKEIAETLSSRPRKATEAFFTGKTFATDSGPVEVSPALAKQIYRYLVKNDYTDDADQVAGAYHEAKAAGTLATLPDDLKPYADQVFQLIESVFSDAQLPKIDDGRKPKTNPLNANFEKKEFQALWSRINQRAVYRVEFDSDELVRKCVSALDSQLRVTPLQYTVQTGIQADEIADEQLRSGDGFQVTNTATERGGSVYSLVKYDLIGKIGELVQLTRTTVAEILTGIAPAVFGQFKENPEHFISEASRIIAEQKATMVIERLAYDGLAERYDVDIFTANQTGQDFSRASAKLKNHVYDYVVTDSDVERRFVAELDTSEEVVVYAKLPRGFLIPTPVGDYNPDWAISFKEGSVRHIYFVAETKGTMSSMKLREIENTKIACARKFFDEIGRRVSEDRVKYDVVTDYAKLMDIVGRAA